jgi:hypothetical protein
MGSECIRELVICNVRAHASIVSYRNHVQQAAQPCTTLSTSTYHFIDTNFKDTFKVRIDGLVQNATDTELVHVQARGMAVVKDLRMAESVRRRTVGTCK